MAEQEDEFSERSARFVEWFTSAEGIRLSNKIQLADLRGIDAGRGVVALEDLESEEELFAIPHNLILSVPTSSSLPRDILEDLAYTGKWLPLIVIIIHEYLKGSESSWYPYLQVLPEKFQTLMFWNDAELRELQASAVVNRIGKAGVEIQWRETIIPIMLDRPESFPLKETDEAAKIARLMELAHMAGSLIMAYAFDMDYGFGRDSDEESEGEDGFVEDDEEEPLKGMIPFADMLNADADRNNARIFVEDGYLAMKTIKPVKAGEQLFNDYGPLPRSSLLRTYGYLTANYAQYDVAEFSHDLLLNVAGMKDSKNHNAWVKREAHLDELGIIDDGYSISRPAPGSSLEDNIPEELHLLLRALTTDLSAKLAKPKDVVNEPLTVQEAGLLLAVTTKRLTSYPTMLSQDDEVLTAPDPIVPENVRPERYIMAVKVRGAEKEVLANYIMLCQTAIAKITNEIALNDKKRKHDNDDNAGARKAAKANGNR